MLISYTIYNAVKKAPPASDPEGGTNKESRGLSSWGTRLVALQVGGLRCTWGAVAFMLGIFITRRHNAQINVRCHIAHNLNSYSWMLNEIQSCRKF